MPFPKKERNKERDLENEIRLRVLEDKERTTQDKVHALEDVLRKVTKRRETASNYSFLKLIVRASLFTAPLWLLFVLSFETDLTLYLSPWGIALILLIYFGSLGLYFYFRYVKPRGETP